MALFSGSGKKLALMAIAVAVAGAGLSAPAQAASSTRPSNDRIVTAYFANWDVYGRQYFVKDIPADKLNVIQYAFGVPAFDKATGAVGCNVLDPWADYQMVYWGGENSVDGQPDDVSNPDQHLFGNFNQLRKLKARYPHLRVEISLGGWTKSTWFSSVAATPERRTAFVKSCVDTFLKGDLPSGGWPEQAGGLGAAAGVFDGIDLDWEYPTQLAGGNVDYGPADKHNATLLFAEFRKQMDALGKQTGKDYLLTAALPASKKAGQYYELRNAAKYLDWVNLMTYDFNVASSPVAAHNTMFLPDSRDPGASDPTWNTLGTVGYYLLNGVPASKLVVGVPFYGQQYLRTGGLYQPVQNKGLHPDSLQWQSKPQPSYHDLVDVGQIVGANGFSSNWNARAGEPWLYNPAFEHTLCDNVGWDGTCAAPYQETVSTLIVYSSPRSIGERVTLVKALGLRGLMAWELSQDSNEDALITEMSKIL